MERWVTWAVLVPFAFLAGCGADEEAPEAEIVVDTLPNGAVHVQNPSTGLWGEDEGWSLVEEVRIGALEGDPAEMFQQVSMLAPDSRGWIHVLDRQAHEIRIFDENGEHVRTLGGPGEGPGELGPPIGMAVDPDDRVWAADMGNNRYTLWDRDGEVVTTRSRPVTLWPYAWDAGFDGDRLLEHTQIEGDPGDGTWGFLRVSASGDVPVDSLPTPPVDHQPESYEVRDDQGAMFTAVPFAPSEHRAVGRAGEHWFGVSDAYRLYRAGLDGDTLRIVERRHEPVPVASEEVTEFAERERTQQMEERGAEIDLDRIPDVKPPFEQVIVAGDGHLWVRTALPHGEERTRFDVFDPEGRYLGAVRAPEAFSSSPRPAIRDGRLWAQVADELDVPYVVGYRIEGYDGA